MPTPRDDTAWHLLPRHGLRPLGFSGRLLVQAAARDPALPVWSEAAVYETADNGLVAVIHHALREAPLLDRHYARACEDVEDVLAFLHAHDPLCDLSVDALYAAAPDLSGPEVLTAAAACARRLRQTWRDILGTCFGPIRGTPPQVPPTLQHGDQP